MKALTCQAKDRVSAAISADEALKSIRDNPQTLVWLDFDSPLTADDRRLLAAPPFGFHELALEDASRPDGQRPKVEEYEDYFFMVMHALSHKQVEGQLSLELDWHEIDLFVGSNFVISVHRGELPEIDRVWQDALVRPGILGCGSDRLTYFILDAVVDHYLEAIDDIEDILDDLEDAVISPSSGESAVQDIFRFKRQLINFRKKAGPLREAINEMTSRNFPYITENTSFYLRDVYDHLIRLSDILDSYRDILTGALDVHLSAVSNRLNVIMKRLTVVATIFMPLTFITGFWGMNFLDLPVGSHPWFWVTVSGMAAITLALVVMFTSRQYK